MKILNIDEAAAWLRCSKRTVYRRKEIPRIRHGGKLLFLLEDLEAYVLSHREVSGGAAPTTQVERNGLQGKIDGGRVTPYHRNPIFLVHSQRSV